MRTINILLVYTGRRGGGSIYSYEVARALNDHSEINVKAVISQYQDNLENWEKSDIDISKLKTYSGIFSFIISTLNIIRFIKLRKEINAFKPDIIYYPMFNIWSPIINFCFPRVPKVVTVHDPVSRYRELNPIHFVQPLVLKQSDYYILLSDKLREHLQKRNIDRDDISIIPHGIFNYYKRNTTQKKNENSLKTILFFGKIKPYKGLGVLLRAFPLIKEKYREVRMLIAGDGDLSEYSSLLAGQEDVDIDNRWLSEADVDRYFREADIVVLPYLDASQSGIIPIAYAYGLPVVVSDTGGLGEQVRDGTTGLLVEPDSPCELAEATLELLRDEELRVVMGKQAEAYAHENWTWQGISNQLVDIFKKVKQRR